MEGHFILELEKKMAMNGTSAPVNSMIPSESLAKVTGTQVLPRSEAVRRIWHYIRDRNLRDKVDRHMVNPDETLKAIFGGKAKISMFEITGLVSLHLR
jgi:upstream activation factor subunit UAF30